MNSRRWLSLLRFLFVPRVDELTSFVIAVVFAFLLFVKDGIAADLRNAYLDPEGSPPTVYIVAASGLFVLGFILSIIHVFTRRKKKEIERRLMFFFACAANCIAAFSAARYLLQTSRGIVLILPVINIVFALSLILQLSMAIFERAEFDNADATPLQTVSTTLVALVILAVAHLWFRAHWSVTFSFCVIYATVFNATLGKRLLARLPPDGMWQSAPPGGTGTNEGSDGRAHTEEDRR